MWGGSFGSLSFAQFLIGLTDGFFYSSFIFFGRLDVDGLVILACLPELTTALVGADDVGIEDEGSSLSEPESPLELS